MHDLAYNLVAVSQHDTSLVAISSEILAIFYYMQDTWYVDHGRNTEIVAHDCSTSKRAARTYCWTSIYSSNVLENWCHLFQHTALQRDVMAYTCQERHGN